MVPLVVSSGEPADCPSADPLLEPKPRSAADWSSTQTLMSKKKSDAKTEMPSGGGIAELEQRYQLLGYFFFLKFTACREKKVEVGKLLLYGAPISGKNDTKVYVAVIVL